MCEAVHKDIDKPLLVGKLINKNYYDIKISLENAFKAHNNKVHTVTKYTPHSLFYYKTDDIAKEVEIKMINSQIAAKKNINPIITNSKVLISNKYTRKGKNLNVGFGQIGNKKIIPGTITGKGTGNYYPVRIDAQCKDLIKDSIYFIDYRLIVEVNENVHKDSIDRLCNI